MTYCLLLSALLSLVGSGRQTPKNRPTIVDDARHAVQMAYADNDTTATFTASLGAGFIFSVYVDGNQDGRWGIGPYDPKRLIRSVDDVSFSGGQGKRCAQYIWSGHAVDALQLRQENADGPSATSGCGTFPSTFTVETTASGRPGVVVTTYRIPKADLFGNRATAHVLLEVLDDTGRHGYYSLANPLVIVR